MRSEYTYVDPETKFIVTQVDEHPGMRTEYVFNELRLPRQPVGRIIEIRFNDLDLYDKENKTPDEQS